MPPSRSQPVPSVRAPKSERILFILFLLSLPLINPWVRGDGVGYYAFVRAPLIQHNLDFTRDYQSANSSFRGPRLDDSGRPRPEYRTSTGHLENHFAVGPAILWSPFLLFTHAGVLLARAFGSSVAADGFSEPYRIAMALASAIYGFLGLFLGFRLALQYVAERWAFLAIASIWWASSLPVYMYFNPSWSHAHSAFTVALFLWYWHRTQFSRSLSQWLFLAVLAGLMLNVYYANALVLAVLAVEAAPQYVAAFRRQAPSGAPGSGPPGILNLLVSHFLFAVMVLACLLPTFITRYFIYGDPFESGYVPLRDWLWGSPAFLSVLFSSNHGLLAWTPLLLFAIVGLFLFCRWEPAVGAPFLAGFLAFFLFIACYPDWAGISSYGNRFFVSLTSLFVLGLAIFLNRFAQFFRSRKAALLTPSFLLTFFVVWNLGLMFQWGSHLIPARGPISFSQMMRNQVFVVPRKISSELRSYFFTRKSLMQQIEDKDIQQIEQEPPQP